MRTYHFILQGKGGVGKSNVASLLTQYLQDKGLAVHGFDTDPVNATFAGYKAFNVSAVKLLGEGQTINQRLIDPFIETLLGLPDGTHAVIDNGASTFLPFCAYMAENPVLPLLQENGAVFLHSVVTGGQSMTDTLNGLGSLAKAFIGTPIVVWLNLYFGEITHEGKGFEDFRVYRENINSIHAIIKIPNRNRDTYGKDMETLLARRQSIREALEDSSWNLMARQRLTVIRRETALELDKAFLLSGGDQ